MSQLIKKPEMAVELRVYLEQQRNIGYEWVVYDTDNPIANQYDLHCFYEAGEACEFAREYQQIFNWHEAVPIDDMLFSLQRLERETQPTLESTDLTLNEIDMNLNNLEKLKEEMKTLGFKGKLIEEMEDKMEKNLPEFTLNDSVPVTKGQVELSLYFKQSGQSDFYYFNKFEVVHNQGKALEEGQKYMVISPGEDNKNIVKKLDSITQAIDFLNNKKEIANLL